MFISLGLVFHLYKFRVLVEAEVMAFTSNKKESRIVASEVSSRYNIVNKRLQSWVSYLLFRALVDVEVMEFTSEMDLLSYLRFQAFGFHLFVSCFN